MLKCVIIDDEQSAIDVLIRYVQKIPDLELVGTETDSIKGAAMVQKLKPDVLFLDIQMDGLNGLELAAMLPPGIQVIFCTAYTEFAVTSYEIGVVDYLIKPIPFNRFMKAVQRLANLEIPTDMRVSAIPEDYLIVKTETKGKRKKIDIDDIDFIEGKSNYVAFHCGDIVTLAPASLKQVEDYLSPTQFVRVHKSYLIPYRRISAIENSLVILKGVGKKIPIGENYKKDFLEKMNKRLL